MDPAAATADGGAFLEFVDYAISVISSSGGDGYESPGEGPAPVRPPWGWAVAQVLKSCCAYSSGFTAAILLSDLFQSWTEQPKSPTSKRKLELINVLKTRSKWRRLPNTITIDSIHEKNFTSPKSVLEAVIVDVFVLHAMEGSGNARILSTEYMVTLLDELTHVHLWTTLKRSLLGALDRRLSSSFKYLLMNARNFLRMNEQCNCTLSRTRVSWSLLQIPVNGSMDVLWMMKLFQSGRSQERRNANDPVSSVVVKTPR